MNTHDIDPSNLELVAKEYRPIFLGFLRLVSVLLGGCAIAGVWILCGRPDHYKSQGMIIGTVAALAVYIATVGMNLFHPIEWYRRNVLGYLIIVHPRNDGVCKFSIVLWSHLQKSEKYGTNEIVSRLHLRLGGWGRVSSGRSIGDRVCFRIIRYQLANSNEWQVLLEDGFKNQQRLSFQEALEFMNWAHKAGSYYALFRVFFREHATRTASAQSLSN